VEKDGREEKRKGKKGRKGREKTQINFWYKFDIIRHDSKVRYIVTEVFVGEMSTKRCLCSLMKS